MVAQVQNHPEWPAEAHPILQTIMGRLTRIGYATIVSRRWPCVTYGSVSPIFFAGVLDIFKASLGKIPAAENKDLRCDLLQLASKYSIISGV